jgi:3-deoxy-D-manno-octulosonate 8-phosphate phosphatase (KDO 8-P phosphatase)
MDIPLDAVAFMGDDFSDLGVLQAVGLAVAPANAHPWVRERVHWRTIAGGGVGAARELCDLLLASQGHAQTLLADPASTAPGTSA